MDFWGIVIGFIALILIIILLHRWYCVATVSSETITVSDKGIVVESYGSGESAGTMSHYMVYTTNGQALKNTNNIWFWKFRSDELQGKLKKGKKYKIMRSKGLGENTKEMMSQTTMNPETRRLIKILPEDAVLTAETFEMLLGDNLQARKDHIAEYGAQYLDMVDIS